MALNVTGKLSSPLLNDKLIQLTESLDTNMMNSAWNKDCWWCHVVFWEKTKLTCFSSVLLQCSCCVSPDAEITLLAFALARGSVAKVLQAVSCISDHLETLYKAASLIVSMANVRLRLLNRNGNPDLQSFTVTSDRETAIKWESGIYSRNVTIPLRSNSFLELEFNMCDYFVLSRQGSPAAPSGM